MAKAGQGVPPLDIPTRGAQEAAVRSSISQCLKAENSEDMEKLGATLWKLLDPAEQDELASEWGEADLNGDGVCDPEEYGKAEIKWFKKKFGDNVVMNDLDERVDFFFKYRDIDGDGTVSWMEWMETKAFLILDMNNQLERALTENEIMALNGLFNQLDLDSDGVITLDEAREYYKIKVDQMITVGLLPALDYYAKQEYVLEKVDHFFRFHDKDGDRCCTKTEFNAEESKFVLMDRFRKQAHVAHGSVLKFEKDLQTSADLEKQPLVLDKHLMEHAKLIYDEHNSTGDGIHYDDLKKVLAALRIKDVTKKQIRQVRKKVFAAADVDDSKCLDFHEFLAVYSFFHVRTFDFDVFLEASDGIGVDEDGDGVCDVYLLTGAQTERYMEGAEESALQELAEKFDHQDEENLTERKQMTTIYASERKTARSGNSTARSGNSTARVFTPRTGQVL